jgi:dipeptidase D
MMMKQGFFKGKRMINLDSEELGVIIIGSAGSGGTQYTVSSTLEEASGWEGVKLVVDGLMGGHSGVDIHLPRINANKLVCEGIKAVSGQMPLKIARIEGGTRGNAIPRSAFCEFQVPAGGAAKAIEALRKWNKKIDRSVEKDLKVSAIRVSVEESLSEEASASIIGIVNEVHQGPVSWSKEIEGLVQTSNNMGIVRTEQDKVVISISSRTSDAEDLKKNQATLKGIGEKYGVEISQREGGSGWKPDSSSPFLSLVKRNYEKVYKKDVKVTAIHAGLECGVLTGRDPELKAVSIGPDIKYSHSPGEHVYIKSVGVLGEVLKALAQEMGSE